MATKKKKPKVDNKITKKNATPPKLAVDANEQYETWKRKVKILMGDNLMPFDNVLEELYKNHPSPHKAKAVLVPNKKEIDVKPTDT